LIGLTTVAEAEALAAEALEMTHPASVEALVSERCDGLLAEVEHLRPSPTPDEVSHVSN